jgi:hypothetical protein
MTRRRTLLRLWNLIEHRFDCVHARLDVLGKIREVEVRMEGKR